MWERRSSLNNLVGKKKRGLSFWTISLFWLFPPNPRSCPPLALSHQVQLGRPAGKSLFRFVLYLLVDNWEKEESESEMKIWAFTQSTTPQARWEMLIFLYLAVDEIKSDRKWKWKENMISHLVQKSTGLLWNAYSAALSYPYYFHPATRLGSKVGQRSKIEPSLANKGWFDVNQSGSCQHCWRSFKNFFVLRFSREKQLNLHILLCCFPLPSN